MKNKKKGNIEMNERSILLNELIKDKKIKFSFYNSSLSLDLLNFCYNKKRGMIEIKFRDIMSEHILELQQIMNKYTKND